jgi:hypothetical protein
LPKGLIVRKKQVFTFEKDAFVLFDKNVKNARAA